MTRDDSDIQIYVFTNAPQRLKMKYGKILESLSENYGVYYFIVDNFKDFLRTFNLNTEFRINKKNWITDSNIRMAIVPTLTFKAYF